MQFDRDGHHQTAAKIWTENRGPMRTSNLVMGETWTFLRRKAGFDAAVKFIDTVEQSGRISVVTVDETVDRRAWDWLRGRSDRTYSYVDATSFEIMRRERISEALAFDGDFSAAGFVEILPT